MSSRRQLLAVQPHQFSVSACTVTLSFQSPHVSDLLFLLTEKWHVTKWRTEILTRTLKRRKGTNNSKEKQAIIAILHKFKFLKPEVIPKVRKRQKILWYLFCCVISEFLQCKCMRNCTQNAHFHWTDATVVAFYVLWMQIYCNLSVFNYHVKTHHPSINDFTNIF